MGRTVVIGNPRAGRGRLEGAWSQILDGLTSAGLDPEGRATTRPLEAVEIAAEARRQGAGMVVAVGGDGTVHEVVNGLLADGPADSAPVLGIVPLGSGCDYVRTFAIPTDLDAAIATLVSERPPRSVDAGEVVSAEGTRYFANIAEVGVGPEVVERSARLPRRLGPTVYFFGFWLTLPRFRRRQARVVCDGTVHDVTLTNLVVAIGQVFGGGMRVAPAADPTDGLFDVQIHMGTKLDYVRGIPKVYRGTHLPHPKITEARAATVDVDCDPPGLIEADGEVLGTTPATFRVVPAALRLKV